MQQADRRPRRVACSARPADMPDRWLVPADQEGQRPPRLLLRADGVDLGGGAALRADDARLVARRRRGRRERALAAVARRRPRLPELVRVGRATPPPGALDAARRAALLRRRRPARLDPRRRRRPTSSGAAAGWPTRWPAAPDDDEYSRVRTSNVETLLIGGELDFATPPQNATKRAAAVPAERPPGRAARLRPHGRLLDEPARGRHAADQHVLRQRQGRRLAATSRSRSTSRPTYADGARQGHRRRRWSASRCSPCSRCC